MQLGVLQGPGHPCNTGPHGSIRSAETCPDADRSWGDTEHGSRPQSPGSAVYSISSDFMYVRTLFLY